MLYKSYEKGNIAIGLDINKDGPKCFALLPNNLAVQTLVMSCPKLERCFYDICLYSSKHSIRNYPLKLFFDIEQKGPDGKKTLITDQILNMVIQTIYNNVYDVLRRFYALEYDMKNLVVLDSGDHIDINDLSDRCSYIDDKTNNMRTIIPEEQKRI